MWRFGEVEFDEGQGVLSVAGEVTELDRSSRAILTLLLGEAGAQVSKERLLAAGWPDRIVHENSLAKAIGRLRQVLGDQGAALESIYGYGYRLNVEAVRTADSAASLRPSSTAAMRSSRRPAVFALAALLVLALIVAGTLLNREEPGAEAQFRQTPPITGDAPDAVGQLLWVDDHPQNNIYEKRFFEEHRIAVHPVTGSTDALKLLAMYDYEVVISDMGRGEDRLAGVRLVEQMRARGDQTPAIIYTVRPDGEAAQQAQRNLVAEAGAQGVAVTPKEVRSVILRLFGNPPAR